jgi:hypothetical protein
MARRPFFSGNYGSALGSTANAANLIARAGQQQGQMYANMGQQIGGMIQQYGLNKEKRDKAEAAFQADAGRLMKDNPQKFVSMQSDPVIGKALKRIQEGKGTQADFDKYNAFRAADKEAIIEKLKLDNARTQQEMLKVQARVEKKLADPRVTKAIADATTAQAEADYAGDQQSSTIRARDASTAATIQSTEQSKELFPLIKKYKEGQIEYQDVLKARMFLNSTQGMSGDDSKEYKDITSQIDDILNDFATIEDGKALTNQDMIESITATGEVKLRDDIPNISEASISRLKDLFKRKYELDQNRVIRNVPMTDGSRRDITQAEFDRMQQEEMERKNQERLFLQAQQQAGSKHNIKRPTVFR